MSTRGKIIVLVLFLEFILTLVATLLIFNEHHHGEVEKFAYVKTCLENHFHEDAEEIQKRYSTRIKGFVNSCTNVIEPFIRHDRTKIVELMEKKAEVFTKEDRYFRSINFVFKDGTVFYHTEDKKRIGTNLSAVAFVRDSIDSKLPLSGLALTWGGLAYRFSYPVYHNGDYVGLVLFVVAPTRTIEMVAKNLSVQCGIYIDSRYTEDVAGKYFQDGSGKTLVAFVGEMFSSLPFVKALSQYSSEESFNFSTQSYKKLTSLPVENYKGKTVGEIVTVMNVTEQRRGLISLLLNATLVLVVVLVITSFVLFKGTGYFLRQVERLQQQLEVKVLQRTKALECVNKQLIGEIKERESTQKALEELSERDMLTKLYNRRKFVSYYKTEWEAALRSQRHIAMLIIDIDFFKGYNDNYGHLAGDAALLKVATAIQDNVTRPRDLVARYGGEEFVCLLPETSEANAIYVAEKLRKKVMALHCSHEFSSAANVVTISIGVASFIPQNGYAKEYLLELADKALYKAKDAGRNCVRISATS